MTTNTDYLQAAAQFLVDLVYPRRCSGCFKRGTWLCDECDAELARFAPPWCRRCGVPHTYPACKCHSMPSGLRSVRSAGPFEGWLRGAITQFKYHGEWARADAIGDAVAVAAADLPRCDALIPVPLHPARQRARGFNQSRLLAERVAMRLAMPLDEVICRTRRTSAQVQLGADARRINVAGAFAAAATSPIAGRSFILVDDVMTTGSTLGACADALLQAGAVVVHAVTAAREM